MSTLWKCGAIRSKAVIYGQVLILKWPPRHENEMKKEDKEEYQIKSIKDDENQDAK